VREGPRKYRGGERFEKGAEGDSELIEGGYDKEKGEETGPNYTHLDDGGRGRSCYWPEKRRITA